MPHTVAQLEKFGIPLRGRPFHGITYLDETHRVDAGFRAGVGMGVRRTALHAALLEAATAAGVRLVHNDIGPVTQDGASVRCGEFRARYLAAADGLHSPIRRSLGLARPSRGFDGGDSQALMRRRRGATGCRCTGRRAPRRT